MTPDLPPLIASYRMQLTPSFGFSDVAALLDPLRRLGISHVYLSPVAEAVPGSTHGYDVVDHRRIRDELGGSDGLYGLLDAAAERGLGVIVDHVPNHVSVERAELNPPWWAMLRDGPESEAARWFDVDWAATDGKVIIPKLGEPLDDVVRAGGLEIADGPDGPEIRYGPLRFPMAAGTQTLSLTDALAAQHYRLQWWRDPARNVRRFFTIDDLVAVRVEDEAVAATVDSIPRELTDHPAFAGVRVDHVDGLAEPGAYLERLRATVGERWLLVEKIMGPGENLPRAWPTDGTTGYEHVTAVEHLLLDPVAEDPLDRLWHHLAGSDDRLGDPDFHELERIARAEVLDGGLRPDVDRLAQVVADASDLDPDDARSAIVALTLELDRYRTYLPGDDASAPVLASVAGAARASAPEAPVARLVELIEHDPVVRTRWQQLTGPVMAKGAEDRAFYRHQRLSSLCEVGGSPGTWTLASDDFHAFQRSRQDRSPVAMLTATTHDTKRSEAVRARSLALATQASAWAGIVTGWRDRHDDLVTRLGAGDVTLALQTVVTAWPVDTERLTEYLVKAAREADLYTDWSDRDETYEADLRTLAGVLVEEAADAGSELGAFATGLVEPGASIGLRVLALQLTCPGVPDLYQGAPAELLSLVDPDNRRPPDWSAWSDVIDRAASDTDSAELDEADELRTRLALGVLGLRRRDPEAFGPDAGYAALPTGGPDADRVTGFARLDPDGRPRVLTVVVRPSAEQLDATVELPDGSWRDVLHDTIAEPGSTDVAGLTGRAGVAVLGRADD